MGAVTGKTPREMAYCPPTLYECTCLWGTDHPADPVHPIVHERLKADPVCRIHGWTDAADQRNPCPCGIAKVDCEYHRGCL